MPLISRRNKLISAAVVAIAAVAVAAPALAASSTGKATEVLSSFKITGTSSVKAGKVTFTAKNTSALPHELVIIRTNLKAGKLPIVNGQASEKGSVGEIVLAGHKSGSKTVTLKKGHYALICNVGDHYSMGMYKDFTVK